MLKQNAVGYASGLRQLGSLAIELPPPSQRLLGLPCVVYFRFVDFEQFEIVRNSFPVRAHSIILRSHGAHTPCHSIASCGGSREPGPKRETLFHLDYWLPDE